MAKAELTDEIRAKVCDRRGRLVRSKVLSELARLYSAEEGHEVTDVAFVELGAWLSAKVCRVNVTVPEGKFVCDVHTINEVLVRTGGLPSEWHETAVSSAIHLLKKVVPVTTALTVLPRGA